MSYASMAAELRGSLPKLPFVYASTLINRSWKEIRENGLWSFNLVEFSWITPPIINSGTATTVQGTNTVQFDATAQAAITAWQIANPATLLTQLQLRIGVGGIYSLIAYNSGTGVATLDRIWGDTSAVALAYTLYRVYYTPPPPYANFRTLLSVRNPIMFLYLNLTMTKRQLDAIDPQRLWYAWPTDAVPYARDTRTGSPTLGYQMYELWGQPVNPFTYQCYGVDNGQPFVNPTDTVPVPLGEDIVLALAKWYAYEWAEANKDVAPRTQAQDWKFLMGKAMDDYKRLLVKYRRDDRDFVDNWFMVRGVQAPIFALGHYNTIAGVAGPA